MTSSVYSQLRDCGAALYRWAGGAKLGGLAILMLTSAGTEGIGFALLAPLLAVIDGGVVQKGALGEMLTLIGPGADLSSLLALFVAVVSLRSVLAWRRESAMAAIRLGFVDNLRVRLFQAVADAEWRHVARQPRSELSSLLGGDLARLGLGCFHLLKLPTVLVMLVAQAITAVYIAPDVGLVAVGCAVAIGVLIRMKAATVQRLGGDLSDKQGRLFSEISGFLEGLKPAKSHACEQAHVSAFAAVTAAMCERTYAFLEGGARMRMVAQVVAALGLAILVWLAVGLGHLATATLMVLAVILARMMPLLQEAQQSWDGIVHMLPAYSAIKTAELRCLAASESMVDTPSPPFLREIRMRNVGFRHEECGPFLFEGVDAVVPAGRVTALIGLSGAGKTTIADLMLGLLSPETGEITVDGTPLTGALRRAWRRTAAYVPQDPFLLNASVRDNMLWAEPSATLAAIERALAMASIDRVVAALPQGLDTIVGDRGSRLSGGERQRLVLAQALLRQPKFLVLDEATSGLDIEAEQAVTAALSALRCTTTVLVIAHRPAMIAAADRIIEIVDGKLIERT